MCTTHSLGEKSSFPKMKTSWKPLGIVTSVVSLYFPFQGNPYVLSIRFPHLETVNARIPPRFPEFETWGTSQVVSRSFHTWKQSTRGFHLVSSHWKLQETSRLVSTSFQTCKLLLKGRSEIVLSNALPPTIPLSINPFLQYKSSIVGNVHLK